MKFLIQLLAIIALAYILELFLPWYYIAVASFVMGYALKSKANFLAGFMAIAILWFVKASLQNSAGSSDLAERVANIFTLPNKELLFLVTSIVGGLGRWICHLERIIAETERTHITMAVANWRPDG